MRHEKRLNRLDLHFQANAVPTSQEIATGKFCQLVVMRECNMFPQEERCENSKAKLYSGA